MKKHGWLISRYLLQNILPYFLFSWLLLSVILFVQQASRYADIFFSVNIPKDLVWQLTFALIPNVVAFTAPMAVLLGVIIGLSKMQGDSELIAIRAAGVGNWQIASPVIILGISLSFFAFFINLKGVPLASSLVRNVALRTALYKLESPIEPGVFNTEIGGYTIYVKSGDRLDGEWKDIFIYNQDPKKNETRLITARSGRIDSTLGEGREFAELVLEDAVSTTVPMTFGGTKGKAASENIGTLRLSIRTKRDDVVKKLSEGKEAPEEMGLAELGRLAESSDGKEKNEARILWQRRLLLSVTPLIFSLLGTVLVLRFNRGGRGFGIFLALVSLIGYYLVTLVGEQLARSGRVSVLAAGLLPVVASALAITWFALSSRLFRRSIFENIRDRFARAKSPKEHSAGRGNRYLDLTTGIRDFDIIVTLLKFFSLTLAFLTAIYLIFTTFEMWKFAGTAPNGIELLGKYLFYLVPYIYLQLAPSAVMIAALATFVIKSRQNEIVTWTAAGQSVYRLVLPCLGLTAVLGLFNWGVQEYVAPKTNQKQDTIRAQIRNKGILAQREGKYWVANRNRIYSFDRAERESGSNRKVENLSVYEFDEATQRLSAIYRAPAALWTSERIILTDAVKSEISPVQTIATTTGPGELLEAENPFNNLNQKPSYLTSAETRTQLSESESESEARTLSVALHKKYTTPFLLLIITIFTAPFALSLSRKGKVVTVGYAVGLWLVFMGISSGFEQAGLSGSVAPVIAVWTPLLLFGMIGVYLFSRVRT